MNRPGVYLVQGGVAGGGGDLGGCVHVVGVPHPSKPGGSAHYTPIEGGGTSVGRHLMFHCWMPMTVHGYSSIISLALTKGKVHTGYVSGDHFDWVSLTRSRGPVCHTCISDRRCHPCRGRVAVRLGLVGLDVLDLWDPVRKGDVGPVPAPVGAFLVSRLAAAVGSGLVGV